VLNLEDSVRLITSQVQAHRMDPAHQGCLVASALLVCGMELPVGNALRM
jgi:hypothetical protein